MISNPCLYAANSVLPPFGARSLCALSGRAGGRRAFISAVEWAQVQCTLAAQHMWCTFDVAAAASTCRPHLHAAHAGVPHYVYLIMINKLVGLSGRGCCKRTRAHHKVATIEQFSPQLLIPQLPLSLSLALVSAACKTEVDSTRRYRPLPKLIHSKTTFTNPT